MNVQDISPLQEALLSRKPFLAGCLGKGAVVLQEGEATQSVADQDAIKRMLPDIFGKPVVRFTSGESSNHQIKNIGVILSGGQAPGGHNVIAGLFDALKASQPEGKLFGFLKGPQGLIDGDFLEITKEVIDPYRNTGGFDIIGSGRTKLETEAQFDKVVQTCKKMNIDGVVVVGGDDSNTNAAMLAQCLMAS